MHKRSESLIRELASRFEYTHDNNRDVIGDEMFSMSEATEEIMVRFAYEYITAYLSHVDPDTDAACWGD